jgi:hypothetical protein
MVKYVHFRRSSHVPVVCQMLRFGIVQSISPPSTTPYVTTSTQKSFSCVPQSGLHPTTIIPIF